MAPSLVDAARSVVGWHPFDTVHYEPGAVASCCVLAVDPVSGITLRLAVVTSPALEPGLLAVPAVVRAASAALWLWPAEASPALSRDAVPHGSMALLKDRCPAPFGPSAEPLVLPQASVKPFDGLIDSLVDYAEHDTGRVVDPGWAPVSGLESLHRAVAGVVPPHQVYPTDERHRAVVRQWFLRRGDDDSRVVLRELRGDDQGDAHCHAGPMCSVLISGQLSERWRAAPAEPDSRDLIRPGDRVRRPGSHFHRLTIPDTGVPAVTLCAAAAPRHGWSFVSTRTGEVYRPGSLPIFAHVPDVDAPRYPPSVPRRDVRTVAWPSPLLDDPLRGYSRVGLEFDITDGALSLVTVHGRVDGVAESLHASTGEIQARSAALDPAIEQVLFQDVTPGSLDGCLAAGLVMGWSRYIDGRIRLWWSPERGSSPTPAEIQAVVGAWGPGAPGYEPFAALVGGWPRLLLTPTFELRAGGGFGEDWGVECLATTNGFATQPLSDVQGWIAAIVAARFVTLAEAVSIQACAALEDWDLSHVKLTERGGRRVRKLYLARDVTDPLVQLA